MLGIGALAEALALLGLFLIFLVGPALVDFIDDILRNSGPEHTCARP